MTATLGNDVATPTLPSQDVTTTTFHDAACRPQISRWLGRAAPAARQTVDFTRNLRLTDLGLKTGLKTLRGTISLRGTYMTIRVDMVEAVAGARINAWAAKRALLELARSHGATTLRIEATVANPRLLPALIRMLGNPLPGARGGAQEIWIIRL